MKTTVEFSSGGSRIFQTETANPKGGTTYCFSENCMKTKEVGPKGGGVCLATALLGSASVYASWFTIDYRTEYPINRIDIIALYRVI